MLTVNWHTRSLSPERLWGDFYAKLLNEIQTHRVWFGTAHEIVEWFRKRRALRFESVHFDEKGLRLGVSSPNGHSDPAFIFRVHHANTASHGSDPAFCRPVHTDCVWSGEEVVELSY